MTVDLISASGVVPSKRIMPIGRGGGKTVAGARLLIGAGSITLRAWIEYVCSRQVSQQRATQIPARRGPWLYPSSPVKPPPWESITNL